MTDGLTILILVGGTALLLPNLYLFFLTVFSLFDRRSDDTSEGFRSRFAVLVPAHDEEQLLPSLLQSLKSVDYPKNLFHVYVVADNCSDSTADVARGYGATAFERRDAGLIGKGHALHWLLERVDASKYDAFIFLDADTRVSANFLAVMSKKLEDGAEVIQGYYTASNPDESSVAALRHAALVLKHYVRPAGRHVLGLSCGLFGTGMVFRASVISRFGWSSYGLAEDIEFYLRLTEQGIKVEFAPEATVFSDMPASYADAKVQNLRWERGRLAMAWRRGVPLLGKGIVQMNATKADAAIEQLIPPLSISAAATVALLALSALTTHVWAMGVMAAATAGLVGHIVIGLASARAPFQVYRAFAYAPGFIAWKTWIYLQSLAPGQTRWTRTDR